MTDSGVAPDSRRRDFLLLFACLLVVGFGNTMLLALLPPLARRLGLADSSVGWIFSLSAFIWVFASSFWGRASDHLGRRRVIALGFAAYAVSMGLFTAIVLMGLAGWMGPTAIFISLLLARAVFGAVGSASSPAAQAYVADRTSASERTDELASINSAFALGAALGPAVCASLAAKVGAVPPIAFTALLAAAAAIAVLRFLPDSRIERPEAAPGAPVSGGGAGAAQWRLARDPRVSAFLIYGLGVSTVSGMLQQTFTFYTMDRLGLDEGAAMSQAAAGLMVGAIALLATQLGLIRMLQMQSRSLMALGAAILALGVLIQIFADELILLLVAQFLQGIGFGLARPGFSGGASLAVRSEEQGAMAGLVVAVNGAGFIISPLAGVTLYEVAGMTAPLLLATVLLASMGVFALVSRRIRLTGAVSSTSGPEPS